MDKTTDAAKSPANERKNWVKPEVIDVDGSPSDVEFGLGPLIEGIAVSSTS